jgi:hypothetical protein
VVADEHLDDRLLVMQTVIPLTKEHRLSARQSTEKDGSLDAINYRQS